jgi:hypothetical protein
MIQKMLQDLTALDNSVWDSYALRREPLIGKLTAEQKKEFAANAHACGEKLAEEVLRLAPGMQPEVYAKKLGLIVEHDRKSGDDRLFACFSEPDHLTVFQRIVDAAEKMVEEQGLSEILGNVRLEDVLIAHEIYHYFEFSRPDLYTSQKLLCLWKIGKLQNRAKLVSLQEIGAMAFAQHLLHLPYSPYIFDVLLLYSQNKRMAKELYDSIMQHAKERA